MTGAINRNGVLAGNPTNGGLVSLRGGASTFNDGGTLNLYDKGHTSYAGQFNLQAADGTNTAGIIGKPDGTLTWNGKNIVRAVVSQSGTADANGTISQGTLFTG